MRISFISMDDMETFYRATSRVSQKACRLSNFRFLGKAISWFVSNGNFRAGLGETGNLTRNALFLQLQLFGWASCEGKSLRLRRVSTNGLRRSRLAETSRSIFDQKATK